MMRVLNDALAQRGLTLGQLAMVGATIGKRGRPGSALTGELLAALPGDYVPPESDGETLVMELIEAFGIDEPERQVTLSDRSGWIGTVDFLWRHASLVLELDGRWHDGPSDQLADHERDERVRALGYEVRRWRYRDVVRDPRRFVRELRALVAPIGATAHQHSPPRAS
jgi:hypothetical protein